MSNHINAKYIINEHVSNDIGVFVASHLNFQGISELYNTYSSLLQEYHNTPSLRVMSIISFEQLESFQKWLPIAIQNKDKVVPFLVGNMFRGDIYALNMFENLYEAEHQDSMLISYSKIHNNPELKKQFNEYGGAEDARAVMTAEKWLGSADAAEIFVDKNDSALLCAIGEMLNVHNDYISC